MQISNSLFQQYFNYPFHAFHFASLWIIFCLFIFLSILISEFVVFHFLFLVSSGCSFLFSQLLEWTPFLVQIGPLEKDKHVHNWLEKPIARRNREWAGTNDLFCNGQAWLLKHHFLTMVQKEQNSSYRMSVEGRRTIYSYILDATFSFLWFLT